MHTPEALNQVQLWLATASHVANARHLTTLYLTAS